MQSNIKYVPFEPFINTPFWHSLSQKKLDEYKLDDAERNLLANYKVNNFKDNKSFMNFDTFSFTDNIENGGQIEVKPQGKLKNFNKKEDFTAENVKNLVTKAGQTYYDEFFLKIVEDPAIIPFVSHLNTFLLATYADLKHHLFKSTLCSPLFKHEGCNLNKQVLLKEGLSADQLVNFEKGFKEFLNQLTVTPSLFFVEFDTATNAYKFDISLENYFKALDNEKSNIQAILIDSFNHNKVYGEPLSNFLALLALRKQIKGIKNNTIEVIMYKDFMVPSSKAKTKWDKTEILNFDISNAKFLFDDNKKPVIYTLNNPATSKTADLKTQLDEKALSTMAIDLNIKLMKWRLLPELDREKVQGLKCLLFGAGTLGCQLSRNLIGWGIRNITFVDYGRVSHSNPVRQSLFEFEDAKAGGVPKAEAAAEKLKKIFPEINSKGYHVEIPMPGHPVESAEGKKKVTETIDFLDKLVEEHDACFLMTDNRESRWLPTVLAGKHNKICITVGLGFDTYVIVRHGMGALQEDTEKYGERLGCYFCNDILSPHNSMKDRTLDQQCTVTRPGLSFISSAYASELLVSLVHHPHGVSASGFDPDLKQNEETALGILPQYIRGSLSEFETKIYLSKAFPNCVACSEYVLKEFCNNRDELMLKVMGDPDYLQSVTKIDEVLKETNEDDCIILSDDDF